MNRGQAERIGDQFLRQGNGKRHFASGLSPVQPYGQFQQEMTDPLIGGAAAGIDEMLAENGGILDGRPEQGLRQRRVSFEHVVDDVEGNHRYGRLRDREDRVWCDLEDAGRQSEDLTGKNEIHDLAGSLVQDLVRAKPAFAVEVDAATVNAADYDVPGFRKFHASDAACTRLISVVPRRGV